MALTKRKTAQITAIELKKQDYRDWVRFSSPKSEGGQATKVRFDYTRVFARNSTKPRRSHSGLRTGARDLKHIPTHKHPHKRIPVKGVRRYYDYKRKDWRSFRIKEFGSLLQIWNEEEELWYSYRTGEPVKNQVK